MRNRNSAPTGYQMIMPLVPHRGHAPFGGLQPTSATHTSHPAQNARICRFVTGPLQFRTVCRAALRALHGRENDRNIAVLIVNPIPVMTALKGTRRSAAQRVPGELRPPPAAPRLAALGI
jgi:hypothetical protein